MEEESDEIISETINKVKEIKKKVSWVGSKDGKYQISWKEFSMLKPQTYDSGFGAQEIASDLIVVFEDGSYMDRWEYDGSEGWSYHPIYFTKINKEARKFYNVKTDMWKTLSEIENDK